MDIYLFMTSIMICLDEFLQKLKLAYAQVNFCFREITRELLQVSLCISSFFPL